MKIPITKPALRIIYECPDKQYIEDYRQTILKYLNSKVERGANQLHRTRILLNFKTELNKIDLFLKTNM